MTTDTEHMMPGQLIRQLLDERGWTQRVLAIVIGTSEQAINMVIAGKRDVDAKMALALGAVFEIQPERFMDLQKSYELSRARMLTPQSDAGLARRAALFAALPIADMIKRRWIAVEDIRQVVKVESELGRFFGTTDVHEIIGLPHAAKKTAANTPATPSQLAWLYRVRHLAREMPTKPYTHAAGHAAVDKLSALLMAAEEARHVPSILSEAGIRYVIVESLPSAKIDGVCFWLDDTSPVIGMSLRYDRIDNFWFVLRHEMEHVLRGHGRAAAMIDAELEGDRAGVNHSVPEEERQANEASTAFCVPQKDLDSFVARKHPFFSERDIIGFSRKLRLHPGLVAGQLRHRLNRWDIFQKHLAKIRSAVTPGAIVDGWGDVAHVCS